MAQAISHHPFIEKVLVRSQVIPYGIISNQSGTEAVLPEYFCFPHHYHNTDFPCSPNLGRFIQNFACWYVLHMSMNILC
jgi:hypothetical protein